MPGLENHDGDCEPCSAGDHEYCQEDPYMGLSCNCANGGHL